MESHSVSESLQKTTYIKGWVLTEHTDQHKNSGSLRHITHTQQQWGGRLLLADHRMQP